MTRNLGAHLIGGQLAAEDGVPGVAPEVDARAKLGGCAILARRRTLPAIDPATQRTQVSAQSQQASSSPPFRLVALLLPEDDVREFVAVDREVLGAPGIRRPDASGVSFAAAAAYSRFAA